MKTHKQNPKPLSIVFHVEDPYGPHRWPLDYMPVAICDTGDIREAFELLSDKDTEARVLRLQETRSTADGDVIMTVSHQIEVYRKNPDDWIRIESVLAAGAMLQ